MKLVCNTNCGCVANAGWSYVSNQCVCNAGYVWIPGILKCQAYNNDTAPCTAITDCLDQRPVDAECLGNCKCKQIIMESVFFALFM